MEKLSLSKMACIIFVFCAATATKSPAITTFKTSVSFDGTDGNGPNGLVQATDGNLYGTTAGGGSSDCTGGCGTVFKITPAGKLTTLHSFDGSDGNGPNGLVQATDGNFYGTTSLGGASDNCRMVASEGCGTVFKITPAGKLTTLHSFDETDGEYPAGLVQASDGNFYGTTSNGGAGASDYCISEAIEVTYRGCGTVFKITAGGKLTTLHSFDYSDGEYPSGLVQATDGNFYGTTNLGGNHGVCCGYGTVFEITARGKLTTLHRFDGTDGEYPNGLVQATDGNFYGTAGNGGTSDNCTGGCGTVFKITPAGELTTLRSFDGSDGNGPNGLVRATDGNFYGTTLQGGAKGDGTVFKITPAGTVTTLRSFDGSDGNGPNGLVQATNGTFYGTTSQGGANRDGTVFSLSVGLGPFVETQPAFSIEKATVTILGTDLTGANKVTFDGTEATFTVVSGSEIKTTVPAGAKTGTVEVTTPEGTLKSNLIFRVMPQLTSFTPTSGPVGTSVTITGVSLTQTTEVTFGGVKATDFTVVSDSEATATVPTGAKIGKIAITTLGGTATSTASFTVTE